MTILQGYLFSDVPEAGSVTIACPAGFSPDAYDKAGALACLLSVNSSLPVGSYSLSWGASSVVVTNVKGVWKAGVSLFVVVPDVVFGPAVGGGAVATISGSYAVGQVLSVVMGEGLTGGTYQWTRDGANISGATSSTYTLVTADAGKTVTCALAGVTYTATGGAVPGGVVVEPPTGILRVVSTLNQANNGNATVAGRNTVLLRWPVIIGSGDVSEIVLSNMGWYTTIGGSAGLLNSLPIDKISFEKDGATSSVPILKNGLRPLTIVALDNDIQYDPIYPAAFGLPSFERGSKYWIRIQISITAGQSIPTGSGRRTESDAGSQILWFDSAATTIVNGVDGYGAFTTTGTAPTSTQKVGYCPIVLGKFVSGDPATWFACGDSIINSVGDVATNPNGWGMFQRAIMDNGAANRQLASLNWAMPSSSSPMMGAAYVYYWFKYARFLINNYGANDFGNQGTTITEASMRTKDQLIYTRARAAGIERILRNKLMFRQSSTDTYLTIANQTPGTGAYGAGWDVGGNADLFNQWLETQVGTLIDGLVPMTAWHDPVATTKWIVDGVTASYATGDGVHPVSWLHSALALNEIRPAMDAIAAM